MAVSNNYEIKNYTLDGIATQFAIPFDVNVDDYGNAINIVVYLGLTELTKDVDYTISVKTINYPDAVSHTGEKLTVFRRTPIEQPVDFVDNGNFTLEDIETGLDRSIMIEQETSTNLDNTVRAQESAELAEQYKDIAIEKASDAEDWANGTRSDGQTPSHTLDNAKASANIASSMKDYSLSFARESEGFAKGEQGGTPVSSGSPYYQANSKYYKEQAALSAGAASGSATSAYNSELAAAASEDMAEKWAENPVDTEVETGRYSSKHWAAKASVSAGAASVSAYNAGLSETAAEDSAEDSEAWAVGQRNGQDVPATDPTYHNNSKYYADQIGSQTVTPDNVVTLTNKTIPVADNTLSGLIDIIYPVGSIYMSVNNVSPAVFFGGTWESIGAGRTLVGVDTDDTDYDTAEKTGGSKTKTLITDNLPAHNHDMVHYHNKGGMRITGEGYVKTSSGGYQYTGGAIRQTVNTSGVTPSGSNKDENDKLYFDTNYDANCWTGITSKPRNSANNADVNNTGNTGNGTAFDVKNPYFCVYMWKRTA